MNYLALTLNSWRKVALALTGRRTVARMVIRWSRKGLSKEVSSKSVTGTAGWM